MVKLSHLSKLIYGFNVIPIKSQEVFGNQLAGSKMHVEMQKTKSSQGNTEETPQRWRPYPSRQPDVYIVTLIKSMWHWHKDRLTKATESRQDEENRICCQNNPERMAKGNSSNREEMIQEGTVKNWERRRNNGKNQTMGKQNRLSFSSGVF